MTFYENVAMRGVPSQLSSRSVRLFMEKCQACGWSVVPEVDVHGHGFCPHCGYLLHPEQVPEEAAR